MRRFLSFRACTVATLGVSTLLVSLATPGFRHRHDQEPEAAAAPHAHTHSGHHAHAHGRSHGHAHRHSHGPEAEATSHAGQTAPQHDHEHGGKWHVHFSLLGIELTLFETDPRDESGSGSRSAQNRLTQTSLPWNSAVLLIVAIEPGPLPARVLLTEQDASGWQRPAEAGFPRSPGERPPVPPPRSPAAMLPLV